MPTNDKTAMCPICSYSASRRRLDGSLVEPLICDDCGSEFAQDRTLIQKWKWNVEADPYVLRGECDEEREPARESGD